MIIIFVQNDINCLGYKSLQNEINPSTDMDIVVISYTPYAISCLNIITLIISSLIPPKCCGGLVVPGS